MNRVLLLTTSLDPNSRGHLLARWISETLSEVLELEWIDYKDHLLPDFDNTTVFESESFKFLHQKILAASGVILVSPIYNWAICSNAKKIIECTGSESSITGQRAAWFDKIVTFVCVGGLPHSYMAYSQTAMSLMLDFKCVINPYMIYASSDELSDGGVLSDALKARVRKTLGVKAELIAALSERKYVSRWEI
jgi:NAD(P)H-dependent FMN reductase